MDTSVPTPQAVATVIAAEGQAFARDPAGQMRQLQPGDVLLEGDTIVTLPGGQVQLAFQDGQTLTLLPDESFQFSAETSPTSRPEVAEAALPAGEADRIIQALERGENIDELLDPTAAGLEGGSGGAGNDFVRLLRIVEGVDSLSYQFQNNTASVTLPEFESGGLPAQAPETAEAPAIVGTIALDAPASVAEGGTITYSATVDVAPQDSPLVLTLSNGLTITIAVGAFSGTSAPVAVRSDDANAQGDTPVTVSVIGASGGDNITLNLGAPATTTVTDNADVTTVSLSADASVAEGSNITYTASLDNPAGTPVTVTLSNGATITIAAGSSSGSVSVPAPANTVHVDAGSVSATIAATSGGNFESLAVNPAPATTTISDTPDIATVSLTATPSVAEGGSITYTASLNNSAQTPVSVTLSNGAVISIATGMSSGTVSLAAPSDDEYVDAGSISTTIASAVGGNFEGLAISPAPAVTQITDTLDTTTVSLTATPSVAEGGSIIYTASLNSVAQTPVTVALSNGSSITIAAGTSSGTVSVAAPTDDVYRDEASISATIASTAGGNFERLAIDPAPATTAVTDTTDTTTVSLTASGSVAEGGHIAYTASLDNPAGSPVTVTLSNGAEISITAGASSGTVSVPAPSDNVYAGSASVSATIASTVGGNFENLAINSTPAVTSITDTLDTTTVSLTATPSVAEGGSITYTASLTSPAQAPVTVTLSNGTTISIAAGTSSGSIDVGAPSDDAYTDAGSVSATIASTSGGNFESLAIDPTVATTSVTDTTNTTTLSLTATPSVAEGGTIVYTASLSNPAQTPVTVTLSNGATLMIAAGASSNTVSVAAPANNVHLDAGSVSASIASATGGNFENLAINPAVANTTITDTLDVTTVSLTAMPSVAEGGSITYTASLTSVAQTPVRVTLSNGATINIAAGTSSGSASVAAPSDDVYIDAGSVSAMIESATGGNFESLVIDSTQATTSITDTIDTTTLSLTATPSVTEGGAIVYTASLTAPAQSTVTVALSNGSSISIAAGSSSGSASVAAPSDDVCADAGTVSVSIDSATGGNFESLAIDSTPATTSITDTLDTVTATLTATPSITEGGSIIYTVSLTSVVTDSPVSVALSNGLSLTIPVGSSAGSSLLSASDDMYAGGNSASATISTIAGGNFENLVASHTPAVTAITDDADSTTVSLAATPSIAEGGAITYTASLTSPAGSDMMVNLSNGATISIAAGASTGSVSVAAPSDDVYVDMGDVSTTITSTSGGNFENLLVSGTPAVTTVTDTIDSTGLSLSATPSVTEGGSIVYTASLTSPAGTTMTVGLSNGATINIAAGTSIGTVSVAAQTDDVHVDSGAVSTTITSATGGNFENLLVSSAPAITTVSDTIDTVTVSLTGDASIAEGANGSYTVSLTSPAQTDVSVTLSYSGTAIGGGTDYTGTTTVTIPAGSSSASFTISTLNDAAAEGTENFTVSLASASGGNFENLLLAGGAAGSATTNIIDDDVATVSLSATPSLTEAGGSIVYTATLTEAPVSAMTVTLSNGATITIAAGSLSGSSSVPLAASDDVYVDPGSVSATIISISGGGILASIDPSPAVTAITDTIDSASLSLIATPSIAEGGSIVYTASLTRPAGTAMSVSLSNGATINIAAGSSTGSVSIAAPTDDVYVDAGSVSTTITSTSGGNFENLAIDPTAATTAISDILDITTVSLTADAAVTEGGNITYTASLNNPAQTPVTVTLSNGASITIAAGASSGTVSIAAPSDDVYLDAGSVSATIASASGGNFESLAINPTSATTTISDTLDVTTVSLTASASVAEGGTISYTATLDNVAQTPVTLTLSNGATITIAAGASTGTVNLPAPADDAYLDSGNVSVTINGASGDNFENLVINPAPAVTAISDTIDVTTVSLTASASVAEGGSILYTANLDNPAGAAVTVTLSNGVVIDIAAGASSGTVSVPAPGEDAYIDAGSISATITSVSGGNFESLAISPAAAIIAITDTLDTTTLDLTASASVVEGGIVTYTASVDQPVTGSPLAVNLSNGLSITIPVGASSASIAMAAPGDVYGGGASLAVTVTGTSGSNYENLVIGNGAAGSPVVTAVMDDADTTTVSLSATASAAEGGNITYTASLNNVAQTPVSVTLSNGATITIAAGTAAGSISVPAPSDDVYLDAGSVSATIAIASGGNFENLVIDLAAATTSISDTPDTTTVSLSADASVAEGGNITYTASLDNPAQTPVNLTLSNGATINLAAGAASGSVSIPAPSDDVYLDAGSVSATIASASGGNFENLAIDPAAAVTAITDTLDLTTVSLTATPSLAEGGSIVYTASLNNVAQTPVSVTLSNGATITIAAGTSSGTVSVLAPSDDVYLDANSISATIASASGGNFENLAINPAAVTTNIVDTIDTTTVSLTASASVAEGGTISYTANLDNVAQTPVTLTLSNGATITIAAGASTGSVSVPAPTDDAYLDAGNVSVTISAASGGNFENLAINPAPATTAISDTLDTTTVSLSADASVAEGGNITYTASLNNVAQTPVSVTLSNGATITIAAGASSGTVSIAAPSDDVYLDAGSVSATIASASGGNFENLAVNLAAATTTISDTLDVTTVSLTATPSVAEGGSITYTANLNNVAQTPVSVTLNNGAVISIASGASSGSVSVDAPSDDVYLDAGSVSATIASASGGNFESLAINPAAVTTAISDTLDVTTVSLTATGSVAEGGSIVYTASLNNPAGTAVAVTLNNGAVINIAAGASSGSVSVAAPSDDVYLDAGSVSTTIASASGGNFESLAINPAAATTSITDTLDTTTVSLTADTAVAEGGNITYTASLNSVAQTAVTITLSNGASITIAAGASSGTVSIAAPSDDVYLDAGSVSATIASASGGNFENLTINPAAAATSIADTLDTTTASLTASPSVAEGGTIVYTASLNNVAQTPVSIALSNGAVISIAAGAASGSVSLAAPSDDVYLDAGSVSATIVAASGGNFESLAINPAAATTSIADTLDTTTVSISGDGSITEGASANYTVSLTSPAQSAVTVNLSYSGTAANGADFSGVASVTIPVGTSSASFSIATVDDVLAEGAENFSVSIASAAGGNFENLAVSGSSSSISTSLIDNDATSISLSATPTLSEAGGTIVYTASASQAPVSDLTLSLSNGATITILAGQTTGSTSVAVAPGEDVYNDPTSLGASISTATGGGVVVVIDPTPAITTITDTLDVTTLSLTATPNVAEGGNITYTASLNNPAQTPVTVTLSNGAVISITGGASSGTVSVAAPTDDVYLDATNVSATISSASGGNFENLAIDPAAAVTAISDTADVTTVSLTATPSIAEGGSIVYTASLNNVAQAPVTITLSSGTTISIAAGASSGTVSVAAPTDDVYLDTGSVSETISAATGGNFENLEINPAAAVTAISDTVDVTTVSLTATPSVAEGGSIVYTASLNNVAQTPVSVTLSNGATITIAAGAANGTVSVLAPSDDVYLDAGSVSATIASASGGNFESLALNPAAATTAISDTLDTTTVSLSADASVAEGGSIVYTASLNNPAGAAVTVTLSNGAVISIAAGASSGSVSVAAPSDDVYLDTGSVSATIASASGGNFETLAINPAAATTSITDTLDTTTVSLTADASVAEGGSIVYTASLNNPAGTAVSVTLSNGATITITAGASSGTASVAAPSDDVYLDAGSISATIASATGGNFENLAINPAPTTTAIGDTINTTTVSLSADAAVAEGGSIIYTASLNNPAGAAVLVTLSNGATITIAAGTSSGSVSVAAPSDDVYLDAGSVSATIASASGGNFESLAINPAAATTAITDTLDDTTVSLSASGSVAEGGNILYTASLNQLAQAPVSVTLSNGASITIAAGTSSGTASVPAPTDDVYVDAGSVSATITSASGGNFESLAINPTAATTSISDTLDTTTVSLTADAAVAEGGSIVYIASLNNVAQAPVSVMLSNGAVISIAAGSSSGLVSVPAPADDVYVDAGSVSASIASASGGNFENLAINPAAATTTISDTLDITTVSISGDVSVAEGTSASYTVSLTSPAQSAVTVNLGYSGTAADGTDFSGVASVTIPAGASSTSFSIATIDDALVETAESFVVGITSASGGNFENLAVSGSNNSVSTSITDNDTTTLSVSSPSVSEDAGYAQFTVSLSNASSQTTTVSLALADGSATGADFGPGLEVSTDGGTTWIAATDATIPAFQTSVLVRTPITNDTLDEINETFSLTATRTAGTPVTNPGGSATGTATIADDDATPSLSIDNVTVNEGAGTASFTVSLSAESGKTVTVNYGTSNGTALSGAGNDYADTSGTLTFNPGTTSQTVTVPILDDGVYEGAETFNVNLSGATNATVATATGIGTILDNGSGAGGTDNDMPTLAVSSPTVAETGGYAQFTVSLSNPGTSPVVFTPSLNNGTATLGTDTAAAGTLEVSTDNGASWSTVSGNVSIAAGSTSVLLRLAVADDAIVEGTENFSLTATVVGGGTANGSASGSATITDNDAIVVAGTSSDDDDVNENLDALAGNDIVHTGVIGNVASTVSLAIDDSAASGLTSNGEVIAYSWDSASRTLTASCASGTVFTVTLNAANDGYAFTQLRGIDHAALAGESHSLDIPLTLVAQDASGASFTSSVFNITVHDDAPSVSGSRVIATENDGSYSESGFLSQATLSNDITGVSWNTAAMPALVFEGKPVLYVDHGNGTLTGELADGTLIFRATIDPTVVDANNHPQYSFELLNTLGRLGIEGSESSYTVISGGNISNLDLGFGGYLVDSMTAVDGSGAATTVNTNNNWIGLGGNWFDPAETLFMSFTDVAGNAGQVRGMDLVVEGQGSAAYTLNWTVTAAIDYAGNTITYSGSVSGVGNPDVPFSIPLSGGALYFTDLQISDPVGSGQFRIALSSISSNDYFADIPLVLDYRLTDADGDTANGLIDVTLMSGNAAPFIGTPAASATVSEEGLVNGLMDAAGSPADTTNATVITGSMAISDPDGTTPTVTLDWPGTPPALTAGGVAVSWSGAGTSTLVGSAGGAEVVRVAITDNGSYTVTLSKAIDHVSAGTEDVHAFDVQVSATDGVATTTGTLTVNIEDDSASVGNLTQAVVVPQQDTNLMIILDVSGSMDDPSGIAGQTRLQAAKNAINQLIDSYDGLGDVKVRVVSFSTGASWSGSVWVDAATGKTQINALVTDLWTNYDAGLADAMTAFGHSGKIAGAQNVSYFLSDGAPTYSNGNINTLSDTNRTGNSNSDEGIQANEELTWTTFLNSNDIKSYALGIGSGLPANAQTLLNPIAYDGTGAGTNTNATVVTNMSQLSAVLQGTVPPATAGNLLTGNVAFGSGAGADGGYMPAITLDGTTYTYDSATGAITVSGSGGAGYSYDGTTHELTLATTKSGSLKVDMDNGQYTYTPSGTMSGTVSETIAFSLTDADGDTASGTLILNVSREGSTITGTSGADTLSGTTGADTLIGGAGNDTLSGLLGGDTFTWSLADRGTPAAPARDTVTDYDLAINSDKLDLRDLLQGELHSGTDAGSLADYLHFSYDSATSTTVLEVKSQGAAMSGPDQIINLSGVDLVAGHTSDQQIIQDLLSKGKLITD